MIRVVVSGATGRMGQVMVQGLPRDGDIEVIGGFGRADAGAAPALLAHADVLVDFTHGPVAAPILMAAIAAGVRPVTGTSGLSDEDMDAVDRAARAKGIAAVWCPTFRLSAALITHFARIAARYMDKVEIIEIHHDAKGDSPSGTSLAVAKAIREAHGKDLNDAGVRRENLAGTRGGVVGGVRIHALRVAGALGKQDIIFSAPEEILRLSYEENGRSEHAPAVARAVREVMKPGRVGLIRGFDQVIGLSG